MLLILVFSRRPDAASATGLRMALRSCNKTTAVVQFLEKMFGTNLEILAKSFTKSRASVTAACKWLRQIVHTALQVLIAIYSNKTAYLWREIKKVEKQLTVANIWAFHILLTKVMIIGESKKVATFNATLEKFSIAKFRNDSAVFVLSDDQTTGLQLTIYLYHYSCSHVLCKYSIWRARSANKSIFFYMLLWNVSILKIMFEFVIIVILASSKQQQKYKICCSHIFLPPQLRNSKWILNFIDLSNPKVSTWHQIRKSQTKKQVFFAGLPQCLQISVCYGF